MHYLSSVYYVNQPLHVSSIFVARPTEKHNMYQLLCIYTAFLLMIDYKYARNM